MGKKDTVTKKYMEDNATFADVFNFLIVTIQSPKNSTMLKVKKGDKKKSSNCR